MKGTLVSYYQSSKATLSTQTFQLSPPKYRRRTGRRSNTLEIVAFSSHSTSRHLISPYTRRAPGLLREQNGRYPCFDWGCPSAKHPWQLLPFPESSCFQRDYIRKWWKAARWLGRETVWTVVDACSTYKNSLPCFCTNSCHTHQNITDIGNSSRNSQTCHLSSSKQTTRSQPSWPSQLLTNIQSLICFEACQACCP